MMDIFLKAIAIFIEVVLLTALLYYLLSGAWLTIFDLGLGKKYKRVIVTALIMVGCIVVVFFIVHLTSFYPTI